MSLEDLKKPFPEKDIEWRIGQTIASEGNIRCVYILAYVTARAVQNRLDEVCGMDGWSIKYSQIDGGYLASIGIKTDHGWVYKSDGSDTSEIEPLKGGLSGALKRAGSAWGIGRYLYSLPRTLAIFSKTKEDGWNYEKAKGRAPEFWWKAPPLPKEFLPDHIGQDVAPLKENLEGKIKIPKKNFENLKKKEKASVSDVVENFNGEVQ